MPPGTNGLAPKLSLSYNSGSAHGTNKGMNVSWVGLGWSLSVGSIIRDLKDGWPHERMTMELNGVSDELVDVGTGSDSTFYKTKSDTFLRVTRDNISAGSRWTITDTSGTVYKFGSAPNDNSRQFYSGMPDGYCQAPQWYKCGIWIR